MVIRLILNNELEGYTPVKEGIKGSPLYLHNIIGVAVGGTLVSRQQGPSQQLQLHAHLPAFCLVSTCVSISHHILFYLKQKY